MNKNRVILAAVGGVIGLAILVMGYFIWSAQSARTAALEGDDEEGLIGLESVQGNLEQLSRKPIKPIKASVQALESNATAVADWANEAQKLMAVGDRPIESTSPAAFKSFIVADARRLAALQGFGGKGIIKPEFTFGPFKEYIAEGKMPEAKVLPELQRKWDDVALVIETLASAGIVELTDVAYKTQDVQPEADDRSQRQKRGSKPAKKVVAPTREPVAHSYIFTFTARASGLIKVLNAFAISERYVVVDDFSFQHVKDALAEALGGVEKKGDDPQSGRRRRRRGQVAEVEETPAETAIKNGIVTDPLLDAPYAVTMTVTVYDFKTMESESKGEEEGK